MVTSCSRWFPGLPQTTNQVEVCRDTLGESRRQHLEGEVKVGAALKSNGDGGVYDGLELFPGDFGQDSPKSSRQGFLGTEQDGRGRAVLHTEGFFSNNVEEFVSLFFVCCDPVEFVVRDDSLGEAVFP